MNVIVEPRFSVHDVLRKKKRKLRIRKHYKKPKREEMAIQEHYLLRGASINPGDLNNPEGIRISAEKTFVEDTNNDLRGLTTDKPVLDTPAINGQVNAMMNIILAAAKQHYGSQNVEWAEPPVLP